MIKKYLECGKIINTHGILGTVKIEPWCDSADVFLSLKEIYFERSGEYEKREILKSSAHNGFILADISGIESMDDAIRAKNKIVFACRDDIVRGEGDVFIQDIIGLPVIDVDSGKNYGKLRDVYSIGNSDIYAVDTEKGEVLVPAVPEFIKHLDTERGVFIKPIEGMFDI